MLPSQPKSAGGTPSSLVLALFSDGISLRHAVLDLYQAGFNAGQIRIAVSGEGKQAREQVYRPKRIGPKRASGWVPKRGLERDPDSSGTRLDAGNSGVISDGSQPLYSEVDIEEMLSGLGVAEETLLQVREAGVRGTLILVDAGCRSREVQSILEWNRGWVRRDMAAERVPPAA